MNLKKAAKRVPSRHEIWRMFDQISPTYDRVNRVMTFGLDQYWRRILCQFLPQIPSMRLLDGATGTGDQILACLRYAPHIHEIIGIDLAQEMLHIGQNKIEKKGCSDKVQLQVASLLELPFEDHRFDCATVSFGIRNVTEVSVALRELKRVLKPSGRLLILEGTIPSSSAIRKIHLFYLRHLLPRIGGWISKTPSAYRYLNETIETFPQGDAFINLMIQAGFEKAVANPLTWGMATVYQGEISR